MTWLEFTKQRFGDKWCIIANTERNRARYGNCITKADYETAKADYKALTGSWPGFMTSLATIKRASK
jgi:hypothetical protein